VYLEPILVTLSYVSGYTYWNVHLVTMCALHTDGLGSQ
jgi:hypothetical protein